MAPELSSFAAMAAAASAMDVDAGAQEEEVEVPNANSRFLDAFIFGLTQDALSRGQARRLALPGLLGCIDTHNLVRLSRLCRRASELVSAEQVWEPRVHSICATWGLPTCGAGSRRDAYFSVLRPRCDGIYVGECRYRHRIVPGASMDAKLMSKSYHWVEYRRYVRLLPPSSLGDSGSGMVGLALVLRDVCPYELAVEALTSIDLRSHRNSLKTTQGPSDTNRVTAQQLRARVLAGSYAYDVDTSRLEVRAPVDEDQYCMVFSHSHAQGIWFAGRLDWTEYSVRDRHADVTPFNLGRSVHGDGGPADRDKDHYPSLYIRPCRRLEHWS